MSKTNITTASDILRSLGAGSVATTTARSGTGHLHEPVITGGGTYYGPLPAPAGPYGVPLTYPYPDSVKVLKEGSEAYLEIMRASMLEGLMEGETEAQLAKRFASHYTRLLNQLKEEYKELHDKEDTAA